MNGFLSPWCPKCGGPPDLLIGARQAMCRGEDCDVMLWNMFAGPEQIDDAQLVELPDVDRSGPEMESEA